MNRLPVATLSALLLLGVTLTLTYADGSITDPWNETDDNVTLTTGFVRGGITVPFSAADYNLLATEATISDGFVRIYLDGTQVCEGSPPPAGPVGCSYSFLSTEGITHTVTFIGVLSPDGTFWYRVAGKHARVRGEPSYTSTSHWSHAPKIMPIDARSVMGIYNQLFNSAIGGMVGFVLGMSLFIMCITWLLNIWKQIAGHGSSGGGAKGAGRSNKGAGASTKEGVE